MLETVQENSSDATAEPSPAALQAAADLKPVSRPLNEDKTPRKDHEDYEKHTKTGESESECGGNKSEGTDSPRASVSQAGSSQQKPKFSTPTPKNTFPALTSTKSRQPEGTRNMTVETETVQSIPQSSINPGDRLNGGRGENSGSVRLKPSNETIRPKKERKKPSAKARSVNQGTGTFRSPLLLPRDSIDDLHGATCVSSTASMSEDEGPGLPGPRKEHRLPSNLFRNALTSTFSRKPSSFFGGDSRHGSNRVTSEASSKADIFEARVANAVEDANSSDSDETFVYESNPPEQQRRPRHHSRTPSVTSSHSIAESRSNVRHYNDAMEERRVNGKRSMKFSNNPFNEMDSPNERQDGTVRSHQPRHYGRWGRGGSHASMFDADSPFTQASKLRNNATNLRHSRPNSPRSPQSMQLNRASGPSMFGARRKDNSFDFDGEGADDERTPLVGTVRTSRSARSGYHGSGANSFDNYQAPRRRSRCSGFAGCMIGLATTLVMVLCAVAFLVMSNRPMYDLQIERVQNVLASEQEIMLDLLVGAVNPNALGITITDMDVNLFAKSKHVGNSGDFVDDKTAITTSISVPPTRRRRSIQSSPATSDWRDWYPNKDPKPGHDHGTDPDDSLEGDAQTMLLGRIFHFDQALTFEGSPIKRHPHHSIGEMRLAHPGNRTEAGGSVRWEEVLKHPFELIIRGVLRYQLPISSRVLSAAVSASVTVHPEDGVDDDGNMRLEMPDRSEDWEWIDWNDPAAGVGPGGERARVTEEESG
jgi:hypothetical protein